MKRSEVYSLPNILCWSAYIYKNLPPQGNKGNSAVHCDGHSMVVAYSCVSVCERFSGEYEFILPMYPCTRSQKSSWYFWGRWSKEIEDDDLCTTPLKAAKSEGSTPLGSPRKWEDPVEGRGRSDSVTSGRGRNGSVKSGRIDVISSDEEQEAVQPHPTRPRQRSMRKKKSGFTTSLTSEQLASLPLQSGANTVVFSITTKYQVLHECVCVCGNK